MSITAAYLGVIAIWSTTPLAIQWSGTGVGYEFGVAARMVIGLFALLLIVRILKLPLPWDKRSRKVYLAGGLPLFVAMSSVYWAAQFIPSGWVSVIYGLMPLLTSLFATLMLGESTFTWSKTTGMLLGLGGLVVVFSESISLDSYAWLGVVGVCVSATAHSLSAVMLKKLKPSMPSISVTTGSLVIATPLFVLNSVYHGLPDTIPMQSMLSIVYLAIVGSAIGFPLYFYCLSRLNPQRVALITLITPVTALLLGARFNDEVINAHIWLGTAFILSGLALYQYGTYIRQHLPVLKWGRR